MTRSTSKPQRLVQRTGPGTVEPQRSMRIKPAATSITMAVALSALAARMKRTL